MNALYLTDAYVKTFDAIITHVEGSNVQLDQTAFYPSSGGQPHDMGTFILPNGQSIAVTSVRKEGDGIIHQIAQEGIEITQGISIRGEIDWKRRYQLMRMHTGIHILCAIIHTQ